MDASDSPRLTVLRAARTILAAMAIVLASLASSAAAQDTAPDPAATESDAPASEVARPFFVSLGIGTGVRLDGFVGAAFRIVEELGYHFEGTPVGPFIALMLAEDAAAHYSMQIGARLGWDLELIRRDFSIVLSPSVGVAFAFDVVNGGTFAYFLAQPALGVAVLLLDRMLGIWLRPIGVDIYIGEAVHGGWAVAAGATLAF